MVKTEYYLSGEPVSPASELTCRNLDGRDPYYFSVSPVGIREFVAENKSKISFRTERDFTLQPDH